MAPPAKNIETPSSPSSKIGTNQSKKLNPPLPPSPPTKSTAASLSSSSSSSAAANAAVKGRSSSTTSGAKRALPGSRRRQPRSKRNKTGTDTRSTVTTTTETAQTPVNVYDAVLGEAEDLLASAHQAQALGRLKMSSAYLLLLHARLVGLGKRFDRSSQATVPHHTIHNNNHATTTTSDNNNNDNTSTPPTMVTTTTTAAAAVSQGVAATPESASKTSSSMAVVQELAKHLSNVDMDSAMVEHLARAAMELHHQRTGRKFQSSPSLSIAWTPQEKQTCLDLHAANKSEADIASQLTTRTEAQVKAFLRNNQERQKESQAMEQEFNNSPRKKGRGRKPPTQAMNTVPNANLDAKYLLSGKGL